MNEKIANQNQMETRAHALLKAMAMREYGNAITHFDSNMASQWPAGKVEELWTAMLDKAGPFIKETSATMSEKGKLPTVILRCKFTKGSADLLVTFNERADIAGVHVVPVAAKSSEDATAEPDDATQE